MKSMVKADTGTVPEMRNPACSLTGAIPTMASLADREP